MSENTIERLIVEKAKAGYPAIYLLSSEDLRSLQEIKKAAAGLKRSLYTWTLTKGLLEDKPNAKVIDQTEGPAGMLDALPQIPSKSIIVLRLFHHFLDDPGVQSKLLDLIQNFKLNNKMMVVTSPVLKMPPEIEKEFAFIDSPLPNKEMLEQALNGIIKASKMETEKPELLPSPEIKKTLIENAQGLTTSEAENAFSLSLVRPKMRGAEGVTWDPTVVMDEKCQTLKKSGLLQYYPPGRGGLGKVGGMQNYKAWIARRKKAFTPEAVTYGLPPPKGVLLVGIPGTGKSLAAKATSEELGIPLLRCDMGRIYGGLVGQSEENVRRVTQVAEAVAPVVLWFDEIEKGFAGSKGSLDSGVGARVFGTILTWMQEKTAPVFVFATANDVSSLPPELLRKGRFDEIFSVTLPDEEERQEILRIHLSNKGRAHLMTSGAIDVKRLAQMLAGYTGAEIEAIINDAMFSTFSESKELTEEALILSSDETLPLVKMMPKEIQAMDDWCKARTRPAGTTDSSSKTIESMGGRRLDA